MLRNVLIVFVAIIFTECATVPITGRKQLSLVSNEEIIPLAEAQYKDVVAEGPLSTNIEMTTMVKTVGLKIQKAVEKYMQENNASQQLNSFNWEFNCWLALFSSIYFSTAF